MRFILIDQKTTSVFDDLTYRWIIFDTVAEEWCLNPKTKKEALVILKDWNEDECRVEEPKQEWDNPEFIVRVGHLTLYAGGKAA